MSGKTAPLDLAVRFIRGIGPRKGEAFEKTGVFTLRDLLYYVPRRYLDRTSTTPLGEIEEPSEGEITVAGEITDAREIRRKGGKSRYEALLEDGTGSLSLIWFRKIHQIKRWIRPGYKAAFSGKVNAYGSDLQIAHPEVTYLSKGEAEDLRSGEGRWVALYPGGKDFDKVDLDSRGLRNLMNRVVGEFIGSIHDPWSEESLKKLGLVPLNQAIQGVHRPKNSAEHAKGWERLKFDELLMQQLLWAWTRRSRQSKSRGIAYPQVGDTTRTLIEQKLPFKLTEAQKRVLHQVWDDMKHPYPMSRLIQGDVGSGKTVVALIAMIIAVENGYQSALMVPTEILAEQHYLTSHRFLEGLGVKVLLLTGSSKTKHRKEVLAQLETGDPCIIIGTHSLIQDAVSIPKLGMVVIDEQHRFGVAQRFKLINPEIVVKPDVMVMTATPIPRSLAISLYGDLEVSRLDEMPPGRGTIKTKVYNGEKDRDTVYKSVRKKIEQGGRAYVVFPLVAESEKLDLQAAIESRDLLLSTYFQGMEVGLLHGRMKIEEKESAMRRFASGETPVLVSTTVIEVGVDVPEATEMVIEHAERFGLAQLHQLRGRVGRGGRDSRCYLVGYPPVSKTARSRLKTMARTIDGFEIAEEDLRIRGAGEFFGIRQHGLPELRFADLVEDQGLLLKARRVADNLLERDPKLENHPGIRREFERVALKRISWLDAG